MGMVGSILNLVKTGQAVLEKNTFKDNMISYMYIDQGQGKIAPENKIWIVTKMFHYFNHTL